MQVRVPRTFIPPEAYSIANNFRRLAQEARRLANELRRLSNVLNSGWEGNSKNNFMNDFLPKASDLERLADHLERSARTIETTKVTVWEYKVVKDNRK